MQQIPSIIQYYTVAIGLSTDKLDSMMKLIIRQKRL